MSMLAEPRRKQKWSVDPRNSAWSNDESKFGQKMLERMGWSKGKGLGRTEQGSTEHIRVKVKNDQLGLGTNQSYEDNWIAHQDDFNQLLADLNNCHGQTTMNEAPSENLQEKTFSLEEKSKTSRKRVHYMKFTKGKDLSSRSQTDLACIFGKRTSKTKKENSQNEEEETGEATKVKTSEPGVDAITKTVTSSLTMQDYFSQRMAQLKKGRSEVPDAASSPESSDTMQQPPADIVNGNAQKRKKRKKSKKDEEADVLIKEEDEECDVLEDCQEMNQSLPEEKKKKKKRAEKKAKLLVEEDCSATAAAELNCNDKPTSDRKIKKQKEQSSETDVVPGHQPTEEESSKMEFVNKKQRENNSDWNEEEELVREKKSEKDKKKRKRKDKLME